MAAESIAAIEIDRTRNHVRGLSAGKAAFQFECCVWCMVESGYTNGAQLWYSSRVYHCDRVSQILWENGVER